MVWTTFSLGAPEDCPQAQFRDNSGLNFICRQITTWNVLHLIHYEWKESQWEKTFESGDFCLLSFLNDIDIDECAYEKGGLSAGTGKLCIFGHLGLVFIWSCFVSCLLWLLYYVICAPVLTEGTEKGGCQDIRVNTVGSYYCSCSDPEFSLASEKKPLYWYYLSYGLYNRVMRTRISPWSNPSNYRNICFKNALRWFRDSESRAALRQSK